MRPMKFERTIHWTESKAPDFTGCGLSKNDMTRKFEGVLVNPSTEEIERVTCSDCLQRHNHLQNLKGGK